MNHNTTIILKYIYVCAMQFQALTVVYDGCKYRFLFLNLRVVGCLILPCVYALLS